MTRPASFALIASLLTSALALSPAAHAAAVVAIPLTGQTPQHLRHTILAAAVTVCDSALREDRFGEFSSRDECIADTVDAALRQLPALSRPYRMAAR